MILTVKVKSKIQKSGIDSEVNAVNESKNKQIRLQSKEEEK